VLRRLLGSDREKVPVDWGKLHNQELRGSYSSPNNSMAGRLRRLNGRGLWRLTGEMKTQ
jgi:hypothetical protein